MAIDPERLDRFLADPNVPDAEKQQVARVARGLPPAPDPGGALSRAADYVAGKVNDVGMAASRLTDPHNLSRPWMEQAQDVATAGAPFVAPEMTLAGTAAGAGARAYGADQETADAANAGTQLLTGGVQAARSVGGLASRTAARFKGVADTMAQRGTLMHAGSPEGKTLFWALADALRGSANSAEKTAAQGVMDMLANGTSPTYGDLDKALQQVQGLGKDSATAGILRSARDAMTQGTPEARDLGRAYAASRLQRYRLPGNLASRGLSGAGGLSAATFEARRGNYGRAALYGAAGLTGAGASVGHALAAAGPAARTAAALSGPAMRSLGDQPETRVEQTPEIPPSGPGEEGAAPDLATGKGNRKTASAPVPSGPFGREIAAVAKAVKIPPELLHAHVDLESQYNPNAKGTSGEIGLMQIMPDTWKQVEGQVSQLVGRPANIHNPLDNLAGGAVLLKQYLDHTNGNASTTARMYNGGPGAETHPVPHNVWYQHEIERRLMAHSAPTKGQALGQGLSQAGDRLAEGIP